MTGRNAIVGFGCAGCHGAMAMRAQGYTGEIHVFTEGDTPPANPMLTTYYVSGKLSHSEMFPLGSLEELEKQYNLTLHTATKVAKVESRNKALLLENGERMEFDNILIATGAAPLIPPMEGVTHPDVYPMRTVTDAEKLHDRMERGGVKSAVIVGASMVGIKIVELMHKQGVTCTLADMAPHIFPVAATPDIAAEIQARLEKKGVACVFSKGISGIREEKNGLVTCFGDGSEIPCDVVALCIGTRASTALADEDLAVERGILVNTKMETNIPGIYAAGDCCAGTNLQTGQPMIIGLWQNAALQGETAGTNMAGGRGEYSGTLPHNITHFMDMDFIGIGDNRAQGEVIDFTSRRGEGRVQMVRTGGKIACINILDNYKISGILKNYLVKRLRGEDTALPLSAKARLVDEGMSREFVRLLENYRPGGETI